MRWYWNIAVRPLLEAVDARTIVEVGVYKANTTAKLLDYAERHDGVVHGVDPQPRAAAIQLEAENARLLLHREASLTALPKIREVDAVLIDGDHNWYTVVNELRAVATASEGREFPLTILHDVDWPYGRRDHYYEPAAIPEEHRQPIARGGLWPGEPDVFPDRGLNLGDEMAVSEGTPRNGVRTAVEDFVSEQGHRLELRSVVGLNGLGILFSKAQLEANVRLRTCLDAFESTAWLTAQCERLEQQRLLMQARFETLSQKYGAVPADWRPRPSSKVAPRPD